MIRLERFTSEQFARLPKWWPHGVTALIVGPIAIVWGRKQERGNAGADDV